MDAYTNSQVMAPNRLSVQLVAKTKQEIVEICAKNPSNPIAKELIQNTQCLYDDALVFVMPISIEAVEKNMNVIIRNRATSIDGQSKVVQEHVLVPLTTEPETVNE